MDNHSPIVRVMAIIAFLTIAILARQPALGTAQNSSDALLKQKIGQLFIIGFPGKEVGSELKSHLADYPFGNFILFKRNISSPEQTLLLTQQLNSVLKESGLPSPLIAIDQEGGVVSRIPIFPRLPSAQSLGKAELKNSVEVFADETASILANTGINLNLAPVLDLVDTNADSFISTRSYSSDPRAVAQFGYAYGKEMILNGVIPTAKHFPGSLNITSDPHHHASTIDKTLDKLRSTEMTPFFDFAKLGRFSAIMLSHFHYTAFNSMPLPASLSKEVMQYLRKDVGFRGLIVTDDFQMNGVKSVLSSSESAFLALQAGADIVMLSYSQQDQKKAFDRVLKGIESGEISIQEIDEKISRIRFVKSFLNINKQKQRPDWNSKKLLALDEKIVDQHIQDEIGHIPKKAHGCLINDKSLIAKAVVAELDRLSKGYRVVDADKVEQNSSCDFFVSILFSKQSIQRFNEIKKRISNKRIVGVNLGSPARISKEFSADIIDLYFPHTSAPKKIAELIKGSAI